MSRDESGRTAVVTGGASGIGYACAQRLVEGGARVAIVDLDGARAAEAARKLGARAYAVDIAQVDDVVQLATLIEADLGPLHWLVNAAGILQPEKPAPQDLDLALLDRMYAVNYRGTYGCCVAFGRGMLARREGAIVNIASISAMRSTPLHAYGPLKAAVLQLGENLAAAWGRSGIRVNTLSPGSVLTPALQVAVDRGERDPVAMREGTATGHIVTAANVAAAAAFLLSDAAAGITGVNLPVDAGWLAASPWTSFGGLPPLPPARD